MKRAEKSHNSFTNHGKRASSLYLRDYLDHLLFTNETSNHMAEEKVKELYKKEVLYV